MYVYTRGGHVFARVVLGNALKQHQYEAVIVNKSIVMQRASHVHVEGKVCL